MVTLYSVSGMPNCSTSMFINFNSNSEILSCSMIEMNKMNAGRGERRVHTVTLEEECNSVCIVLSLDGHAVVVGYTLEDLCDGGNVDTKSDVSVAYVVLKAISTEEEGDKGSVVLIHRLKLDASACAVEVGLVDQVLDGINDLLEEGSVSKLCLEHGCMCC